MSDLKTQRRGLVLINTGHGKGKSTAAFGTMMRALGRGFRVGVVQFIKGDWQTGEEIFCRDLENVDFHSMGLGFTWESEDLERDRAAARQAWEKAREFIKDDQYDLLLFDELTYCFHFNWLTEEEVLLSLKEKPAWKHIIITGRDCPQSLIQYADLVTEMGLIKHPFEAGVPAQKGVEF